MRSWFCAKKYAACALMNAFNINMNIVSNAPMTVMNVPKPAMRITSQLRRISPPAA